jgi:L-seryl-tRNA(Ser) seleniumtransferase
MSQGHDSLRELPSIDRLLNSSVGQALAERFNRDYLVRQCRTILDEIRVTVRQGQTVRTQDLQESSILRELEARVHSASVPRLTRVVNATGTLLHTNLGRAVLPQRAIESVTRVNCDPVNLEYDLTRGERGRREEAIEHLLVDLTGAEAATVVNNNAAAVLLTLNTLGENKEIVVSRGELVEIGGAFRIPEIMAKSGVVLKEVGTTNRTHPQDYENAIGPKTAALLKVHTSNYKIVGFSSNVELTELVRIGQQHNVPVIEDLGSGALVDLSKYGLPKEPIVSERISQGADVVTFSGDKVLGGPQAGLIVGKKPWLQRIVRNPIHRAVRAGKMTIAALEATLEIYQQATTLAEQIPVLRVFTRSLEDIDAVGSLVLARLQHALGQEYSLSLEESAAQIGSGALPTEEIPTRVIAIRHGALRPDQIAERFRNASPPIIGRIHGDRFILDLRTIFDPMDLVPVWSRS